MPFRNRASSRPTTGERADQRGFRPKRGQEEALDQRGCARSDVESGQAAVGGDQASKQKTAER